jgi:hypothetical protein
MNIPATGVNKQKAAFFKEVAQAFELLAIFYGLSSEDQLELLRFVTQLSTKTK